MSAQPWPNEGRHGDTLNDKDPLAPVVVAGQLVSPLVVATGVEAGELFATYGRGKRRR